MLTASNHSAFHAKRVTVMGRDSSHIRDIMRIYDPASFLAIKPAAGLQTSRARRESAFLGLGSDSRALVSARSRKLNRFSDSARLGREPKSAARTRLGLLFSDFGAWGLLIGREFIAPR